MICDGVEITIYTMYFYRPQRSYSKVMFLHVSVILSTGTATAADGTHPTGMHSCLLNVFVYYMTVL